MGTFDIVMRQTIFSVMKIMGVYFICAASSIWYCISMAFLSVHFAFWMQMMAVVVTVLSFVMGSFQLPSCTSTYPFNAIKWNNFAIRCPFLVLFFVGFHYVLLLLKYFNISTEIPLLDFCWWSFILFLFLFRSLCGARHPSQRRNNDDNAEMYGISCIMVLVGERLNKV